MSTGRILTKEEFEALPELKWEVYDTFDDRECSINHLQAKDESGKYLAGCYCNDGDGTYPDFDLDVVFIKN